MEEEGEGEEGEREGEVQGKDVLLLNRAGSLFIVAIRARLLLTYFVCLAAAVFVRGSSFNPLNVNLAVFSHPPYT